MDDWRIEGDEPKVQHRHDDGWVEARVEIDQTALEAAVCDCGARIPIWRDAGYRIGPRE